MGYPSPLKVEKLIFQLIDKAFLKTYIYMIFKLTQTIKEFYYDKRNK